MNSPNSSGDFEGQIAEKPGSFSRFGLDRLRKSINYLGKLFRSMEFIITINLTPPNFSEDVVELIAEKLRSVVLLGATLC